MNSLAISRPVGLTKLTSGHEYLMKALMNGMHLDTRV
jgi:hypothetical protein